MDYIISSVDFIRIAVYNTLYYSFQIGQYVIMLCKLITDLFVLFLKGLNVGIAIIADSVAVFSEDVSNEIQKCASVVPLVIEEFQKATSVIFFIMESIFSAFIFTHTSITNVIQSLFTLVVQTVVHMKKLLVLFGSGVWFAITFLPLCLFYLLIFLKNLVLMFFQEVGSIVLTKLKKFRISIRDVYDFVTDVPIESVVGLLITISIVYIFTQFYMTIFAGIQQHLSRLLIKIRRWLNNTRRNRLLNSQGTVPVTRSFHSLFQRKENFNFSNDDKCCIICQERLKCILLLPCRHVCLCTECNIRLQLYDKNCPICRNYIEDTMRIFV